MKRIVSIIIILLFVSSFSIQVYAAMDNTIEPMYLHINTVGAGLTIDETTGIATCTGKITAKNTYSVKIIVRLQQKQNGSWYTIQTWTKTGTLSVSSSDRYAIAPGYQYRVYTTAYVYDSEGVIIDTGSATQTVNYPTN